MARRYHSAVRLADGNVLIVGGYVGASPSIEQSADLFDVATAMVSRAADAPACAGGIHADARAQ